MLQLFFLLSDYPVVLGMLSVFTDSKSQILPYKKIWIEKILTKSINLVFLEMLGRFVTN